MLKSALDQKYLWTQHSRMKMRHYRLTESRIKRIIRHPARVEEGILEGAIAAMQPASASASAGKPAEGKRYSEIWVMYVLVKDKSKRIKDKSVKIKVITAWRYPGRAPEHDPVPADILREIRKFV